MTAKDGLSCKSCGKCFNDLRQSDTSCLECGFSANYDSDLKTQFGTGDFSVDSPTPFANLSWYYADATRKTSEELLMKDGQDGSYLLRPSSLEGELVLSIRYKDSVIHVKIHPEGNLYNIDSKSFTSFEDLVSYYQSQPIIDKNSGIITGLRYPLERPMQYDKLEIQPSCFNVKTKVGFMTKLGGIVKNWKKRWFVLDGDNLSYHREQDDTKAIRTLDLNECKSCQLDQESGKPNCFKLEFEKRTFHLMCNDETDVKEWMGVIQRRLWTIQQHRT